MDLTFASCEHSMEDRRQMRNDAWTLAKSFAIFISPNWSVSCHSKRIDSIYILKICCRSLVCLFIFCANLYSRRGGIWISLVSVAFCLRGYNARFQGRGGGQVPSVCALCMLCVVKSCCGGGGQVPGEEIKWHKLWSASQVASYVQFLSFIFREIQHSLFPSEQFSFSLDWYLAPLSFLAPFPSLCHISLSFAVFLLYLVVFSCIWWYFCCICWNFFVFGGILLYLVVLGCHFPSVALQIFLT